MKLDRNITGTGRGKYGLINNRKLFDVVAPACEEGDSNDESMAKLKQAMKVRDAIGLLESLGILDWGPAGTASEFFVIKLRDQHAQSALKAYARDVEASCPDRFDMEYQNEILELACRAGLASPFCKKPD